MQMLLRCVLISPKNRYTSVACGIALLNIVYASQGSEGLLRNISSM